MKIRLKHGVGWRLTCRDIFGIFVLCMTLLFVLYDKNFAEAFGPQKTFHAADRVVTVKIVVDPSFIAGRPQKEWANEVFITILGASKMFERDFGIRLLNCDLALWEDGETAAYIKKLQRAVAADPCDVVLAFTKRNINADGGVAGIAPFGGATVLVQSQHTVYLQQLLVVHELGHIFWASHTDEERFFMSRDVAWMDERWDEFNWRMVMFQKYRNFHKYDFLKVFKAVF